MRRRDLLRVGATFAGSLAASRLFAQTPGGLPRAAVVIGVDSPGHLPPLRAAASGALAVADWLAAEQFEVKRFIDSDGPVHVNDVFSGAAELVRRGTLGQLVVYFAGHGFLRANNEIWMLSDAPGNPNDAISLDECVDLARYQSGIPNVVFISDACRSIPETIDATRVQGSLIFPNDASVNGPASDVDLFLAALPGEPAFEVPVDESTREFEGIYTSCFLDAFRNPDTNMVRTLSDGERVVPSRKLKSYLLREVRKRAAAKSIQVRQDPDTQVVSEDETYIGHVAAGWIVTSAPPTPALDPTISDVATFALEMGGLDRVGFSPNNPPHPLMLEEVADLTGYFEQYVDVVRAQDQTPDELRAETGFVILGADVKGVAASPGIAIVEPTGRPIIQIGPDAPAGSIAIQFASGTGTVVASIPGFIGTLVVDEGGVSSVTYAPARSTLRWAEFQNERDRLESLRAVAATSARFGVFRIEGTAESRDSQAARLADQIRILKGIDPTLGIYAAYSYYQAGLVAQVRSVRDFMRSDLEIELFDVAMLAGAFTKGGEERTSPLVPFCPMLSQGWGLMRVRNAPLAEGIAEARNHLRPALWTSLDAAGMDIVMSALRDGRVQ